MQRRRPPSGQNLQDSSPASAYRQTSSSPPKYVFVPTTIQLGTIAIFGATILSASLWAEFFSDDSALAQSVLRSRHGYSSGSSLYPEPFFANKRNIFNQYGVKKAWGWTSLVLLLHLIFTRILSPPSRRGVFGSALRWVFATIWWLLVTAWFFGPSLTNRVLIFSGAQCQSNINYNQQSSAPGEQLHPDICLRKDGVGRRDAFWHGGHDISGHTFLLTLSSLTLITFLERDIFGKMERLSDVHPNVLTIWKKVSVYITTALIVIWWWMSLMTSFFFHHPAEKMSGYALGVLGWWTGEQIIQFLRSTT